MKTHIGKLQVSFRHGDRSFSVELPHEGLKKQKVIRGPVAAFVQRKADLQANEWDKKWEEGRWGGLEGKARLLSDEAKTALEQLKQIIHHPLLDIQCLIEKLKDRTPFLEPRPIAFQFPSKPKPKPIPDAPVETKPPFEIDVLFDMIPWLRRRAIAKFERKAAVHATNFKENYSTWQKTKLAIEAENIKQQIDYDLLLEKSVSEHKNRINQWKANRSEFLNKQKVNNEKLDFLKNSYLELKPDAIHDFFSFVLEVSEYPDCIDKEFKVEYLPEIKTLLIDYSLPRPESIPTLKEVRYVKAREALDERHISQSEHAKLYDDLLYQIALRTIYEVLKADGAEVLEAVIFNGWVRTIDRSTGKEIRPCVMSLQTKRNDFMSIDLAKVDPKACFKFLKGVGSSKLYQLAGIAPILQMQKNDKRFTQSYDVVDSLEDSYNLATMDWEDFEHLIRELFEKEFTRKGCEVKVTRASRDGGVDAIIFDPDPIHGGKIVVQAKRYTNPVGVSAVRDLYGTVLNEGANKGILVTTSDFGPDSYSFANGKPLVLFNGGNLLHLLEKHGHKARIDLHEAKL